MFKRYMIFASDQHDNVSPFSNIVLDTDSEDEAMKFTSDDYEVVVFDREEGVIISHTIDGEWQLESNY